MKKKNVRKTLAGVMALSILSGQLVTAAEVVSSVDTVPAEMYNENLDIAPEMDEVINALTPEPDIPSVQPSADPIVMTSTNPVPPMPTPAPEDVPVIYDPFTEESYEEEEKLYKAFSAAKFRLSCIAEALYSDEELTEVNNEILDSLQSATSAYEIDSYVDYFISRFLKIAEERNEIETYKGIVFFKLDILREKYIANQNNSQAIEPAFSET